MPVLVRLAVGRKAMSRGVVVVQLPVVFDILSDAIDSSCESLAHFQIKLRVDGLSTRNKFMVDDAFDVKKDNEHGFHFVFACSFLFWASRGQRCHLLFRNWGLLSHMSNFIGTYLISGRH